MINTYYEKGFESLNYKKLTYAELLNIQENISKETIYKLYEQIDIKNKNIENFENIQNTKKITNLKINKTNINKTHINKNIIANKNTLLTLIKNKK